MDSSPHLIFKSDAFPPVAGEDEDTNPGIFGKTIAGWLAQALGERGYNIDRTLPEDFGRLIQVSDPDCSLYVAVSSTDDTATEWRAFVFAEVGLFARLKGKGSGKGAKVSALYEALRTILTADARVRDLNCEN